MENNRLAFYQNLVGSHMEHDFSPVAKWLRGKLLEISEGGMRVEYVVRPDMCNPMGTLHGGIAATILDDITGTMVFALGREFAFTSVNLNCDFLSPAVPGDTVTATATLVRAGKNIVHVDGLIVNADGRIVAKSTSNLLQIGLKIPENVLG